VFTQYFVRIDTDAVGLWDGASMQEVSFIGANNGQWRHIVLVYSVINIINIYGNGIFLGSVNTGKTHEMSSFGRDTYYATWFNGSINDARFYNRALEQKEITSYFQHTRGKYGV